MKLKKWLVASLVIGCAFLMARCGANEDGSIGNSDRSDPRYSPTCEANEREWIECSGTIVSQTVADGGSYVELRPDGYDHRTTTVFMVGRYGYGDINRSIDANVTFIAYSHDGWNLRDVEITDTSNEVRSFWCIPPGVWYPTGEYKDMHGYQSEVIIFPTINTKEWPLLGEQGKNMPRGIEFKGVEVVDVVELRSCPAKPYEGASLLWSKNWY